MYKQWEEELDKIKDSPNFQLSIINLSGRQRMLLQRTALFCFQLVCSRNKKEQEAWRVKLINTIDTMEKSHHSLIEGDDNKNIPRLDSEQIKKIYFEPPLKLDQKMRLYIERVRLFCRLSSEQITLDNFYFNEIQNAAFHDLLSALEFVVHYYENKIAFQFSRMYEKQEDISKKIIITMAVNEAQSQQIEQLIAEQKKLKSKVIHTEKMASIGELLSGITHEINNPMNCIAHNIVFVRQYTNDILSLLNYYLDSYPSPLPNIDKLAEEIDIDFVIKDLAQILDIIEISSKRILDLIYTINNFSRRDNLKMQPFNINQIIDDTLKILNYRILQDSKCSEIEIIKEYTDLPLVQCYGGQINQVFMNILSNAIDVLDKQLNRRTIKVHTESTSNESVIIRIIDNGPGMSETVKARIFEPFFTTKPVGKGTGLGLAISQTIIVQNHCGTIDCISHPGKGTEFKIELPIIVSNKCFTLPQSESDTTTIGLQQFTI